MKGKSRSVLVAATLFLVAGIVILEFCAAPRIVSILLMAFGWSLGGIFIGIRSIRRYDEMVRRVDMISGYYTSICTLYFFIACSFLNFFHPIFDLGWFMLTSMLFMSTLFIGIRHYLLKRGVSE